MAEAEQLRKRARFDEAVAELSYTEDRLARLSAKACRPIKGNDFLADRAIQESWMRLLSQLRDDVKTARELWDAARREYSVAATELEKLESLRSEAWDEYRDETQREVQKDLDETVLRNWSSPEFLME